MENPLLQVQQFGQSLWYDNISRALLTAGELQTMVERDGLRGVTSNPAIFEKAIANSSDYDQAMQALIAQGIDTAQEMYEHLAIQDIQLAADVLSPVYIQTRGQDGYVSFEVSPHLAHDTQGTLDEARRFSSLIGRDNVMIKVPGTPAGIPAIRQLISEGININVTLLFAVDVYAAVADAYMTGLEQRIAQGEDISTVASVASFFVSRIDSLIDEQLHQTLRTSPDPERRAQVERLLGKTAIANARVAYARYTALVAGKRWHMLAARGARPQRLLWASTSTKNPAYPKTLYVDELIGPDTVNTLPEETFSAFRRAGCARPSLTQNWDESISQAYETLQALSQVGISLKDATDRLLVEGVKKFCDPFDTLLRAIAQKRDVLLDRQYRQADTHAGGV